MNTIIKMTIYATGKTPEEAAQNLESLLQNYASANAKVGVYEWKEKNPKYKEWIKIKKDLIKRKKKEDYSSVPSGEIKMEPEHVYNKYWCYSLNGGKTIQKLELYYGGHNGWVVFKIHGYNLERKCNEYCQSRVL